MSKTKIKMGKIGKLGKLGITIHQSEVGYLARSLNAVIEKQGKILDWINNHQDQPEVMSDCCGTSFSPITDRLDTQYRCDKCGGITIPVPIKDQPEEREWYCECGERVDGGEHICEEDYKKLGEEENEDWREEFHKKFVVHFIGDREDVYNFYGFNMVCPDMERASGDVDRVIDFIEQEKLKSYEEGREDQQKLDCDLYGTAVATEQEVEEGWKLKSKLKE